MEAVEEKKTEIPEYTFYTVTKFSERHQFVTEGGLRFQIFNAGNNGLTESGAIVRIGRKVLIDEPKYFGWIKGQQKG
jgi:hypothetical protein